MTKRAAKQKHIKPDGAKVFHIVDDMQVSVRGIRYAAAAIRLIAEGLEGELASDALYGVANAMEGHVEKLNVAQEKAFHLTWGYVFTPEEVPKAETA